MTIQSGNFTFSLWGWAVKIGSTDKENRYSVYVEYKWDGSPMNFYTDKLAMAWQSNATPFGDPSGRHFVDGKPYTNTIDKKLVSGDSWNVDMKAGGSGTIQEGYGYQELRAPLTAAGTSAAVQVGYVHRLAPGSSGVILAYGLISFTGSLQTEYNDRFNFTY